jgi:7-cyano-7-deazaguanine synthase
MSRPAVVLCSGGLDSTTCIALAIEQGFEVTALSFDYGQRHRVELHAAGRVLEHYGIERHLICDIGLFRKIGGSSLTSDTPVPQQRSFEEMSTGIPSTYVPARNTIFLSYAIGIAETIGASDIFIGVNALDHTGYPDCRPQFIKAFEHTANLATRAGVEDREKLRIHTPLVDFTKTEIIRLGLSLGAPYHLTHSCYTPTGETACGQCDACLLRIQGFQEAGISDPISYISAA